jgi:hypothetical protein
VNQVKEVCQTRHPRLRQYKHEFWDMFYNFFDAVNITNVLREVNHRDENLASFAIALKPPNLDHLSYSIKVMHMHVVPDNRKPWQYFEDDEQIKRFFTMVDEYTNMSIYSDGEEEEEELYTVQPCDHFVPDMVGGHKVIQLKTNFIPKGLVPLERLFDLNDVPLKPSIKTEMSKVEDYNLGTKEDPKFVNLSETLCPSEKEEYVKLFRE